MSNDAEAKVYGNGTGDYKYVGSRIIRPDGPDKVTGRARYGADFSVAGMVHGTIVRSPHAHAKIKSIDFSAALKLPGVLGGVSAEDFPDLRKMAEEGTEVSPAIFDLAEVVMARHKVVYHGQPVAAIAATTLEVAAEAAKLITVEYEVLPHVVDMEASALEGAPVLHDDMFTTGLPTAPTKPSNVVSHTHMEKGDLDAGFAAADFVVERCYSTPTSHQGYIEPHACVAQVDENGKVEIWASTQGQFEVRTYTSGITGIDISKIKVTPSEIGGGFGGKTVVHLEPVAAILSRKIARPVKMVMDREDIFRCTSGGAATRTTTKIGVTKDGKITAMKADVLMDAGAFKGSPLMMGMLCGFGCYVCENTSMHGVEVVTNRPKISAYRAPGAPQTILATECVMNELADKLGMDPIDFRLLNAVEEGDPSAMGVPYKAIGLRTVLEQAKQHPNYQQKLEANQGRGISAAYWLNFGMQSSTTINIAEDGGVTIILGSPDIGGSRASMTLMAAEVLGVSPENIRPNIVDTDTVGFNDLTGGSRVTLATGAAVVKASEALVEELKSRAASLWQETSDQVTWQDGKAISANADKELSLAQIAAQASVTGGPLTQSASLTSTAAAPGFSVNLCDVEVDKETGKVELLRYTCIQDAGKAIHPSYVEGQMQGGASQGIGWALNEEYLYNDKGILDNASFLDYRIPVASDLPMMDTVIVEVPNVDHPFGVRGVGEAPICAPMAAVVSAVNNAAGTRVTDLPLSPPKLLAAIDAV